eukprot:PhM_4_TR10439/c0_g1_i1/m.20826
MSNNDTNTTTTTPLPHLTAVPSAGRLRTTTIHVDDDASKPITPTTATTVASSSTSMSARAFREATSSSSRTNSLSSSVEMRPIATSTNNNNDKSSSPARAIPSLHNMKFDENGEVVVVDENGANVIPEETESEGADDYDDDLHREGSTDTQRRRNRHQQHQQQHRHSLDDRFSSARELRVPTTLDERPVLPVEGDLMLIRNSSSGDYPPPAAAETGKRMSNGGGGGADNNDELITRQQVDDSDSAQTQQPQQQPRDEIGDSFLSEDTSGSQPKAPTYYPLGRPTVSADFSGKSWSSVRQILFAVSDGYNDPEHPNVTACSTVYMNINTLIVILSVIGFTLETLPDYYDTDNQTFRDIDIVCTAFFSMDVLLRFITTPTQRTFWLSWLTLIDIGAILPFYVELITGQGTAKRFTIIRVLRLLRVVRVLKLSRNNVGMQAVAETFTRSHDSLILMLLLFTITLVVFSSIVYFAEISALHFDRERSLWYNDDGSESAFQSIPDAFWWCLVTITTVGYGDAVPTTNLGKTAAGVAAMFGVLVIAFPTIILGATFQEIYTRRHQQLKRQRIARQAMMQRKRAQELRQQQQQRLQALLGQSNHKNNNDDDNHKERGGQSSSEGDNNSHLGVELGNSPPITPGTEKHPNTNSNGSNMFANFLTSARNAVLDTSLQTIAAVHQSHRGNCLAMSHVFSIPQVRAALGCHEIMGSLVDTTVQFTITYCGATITRNIFRDRGALTYYYEPLLVFMQSSNETLDVKYLSESDVVRSPKNVVTLTLLMDHIQAQKAAHAKVAEYRHLRQQRRGPMIRSGNSSNQLLDATSRSLENAASSTGSSGSGNSLRGTAAALPATTPSPNPLPDFTVHAKRTPRLSLDLHVPNTSPLFGAYLPLREFEFPATSVSVQIALPDGFPVTSFPRHVRDFTFTATLLGTPEAVVHVPMVLFQASGFRRRSSVGGRSGVSSVGQQQQQQGRGPSTPPAAWK